MIKVVYNSRYGGYNLSKKATEMYIELSSQQGIEIEDKDKKHLAFSISRHDPILVQVVETLGEESGTKYSFPKIKEIPEKYKDHYKISEYDGLETVGIRYDLYDKHKLSEIVMTELIMPYISERCTCEFRDKMPPRNSTDFDALRCDIHTKYQLAFEAYLEYKHDLYD